MNWIRRPLATGGTHDKMAHENVKKRWMEQGIWNNKWKDIYEAGQWKHEEPLEVEPESETDLEAESSSRLLPFPSR